MAANSRIVVESVTVGESAVESTINYTGDLRRFFGGDTFRAEYDVELGDVPDSIAILPVLAHVCPVAWANGADVYAPVVDETYAEALRDVQAEMVQMYPEFMQGGELHADRVADATHDREFDGSGLLYSGGVDSMASYVRHRDEDPHLISVQGWTIRSHQDEEWSRLETDIRAFADERDLETRFVRANIGEFLDTPMLHAHYKQYLVGSWYSGVGHGIGLLSLCAPLSWRDGLDQLYMAATHSEGFSHPWGSNPDVDGSVRWGRTRCDHDAYELSRQQKVELLSEYVRDVRGEGIDLEINTCNEGTGENCSRCEKCCRTAAAFALTGLDPNDLGFDVDAATYDHVREQLLAGEWIIDENFLFQWEDLQAHAREADLDAVDFHDPAAAEFFRWLADADVERDFVERLGPPQTGRLVQTVARHTPYPVYHRLYPVYTRLKERG